MAKEEIRLMWGMGINYALCELPISMSLDFCAQEGHVPSLRLTYLELREHGIDAAKAVEVINQGLDEMQEPMPESWVPVVSRFRENRDHG